MENRTDALTAGTTPTPEGEAAAYALTAPQTCDWCHYRLGRTTPARWAARGDEVDLYCDEHRGHAAHGVDPLPAPCPACGVRDPWDCTCGAPSLPNPDAPCPGGCGHPTRDCECPFEVECPNGHGRQLARDEWHTDAAGTVYVVEVLGCGCETWRDRHGRQIGGVEVR